MATWWMALVASLTLPAAEPAADQAGPRPTGLESQAAEQAGQRASVPSLAAEQTGQPASTARSGRELMAACRAALQRWARVGDADASAAAIELLGLYRELQQDTGLAVAQREGLRLVVRRRLLVLAEQIERQATARRGEKAAAAAGADGQVPPTIQASQQMAALAQQAAWPGMGPGMMPGGLGPGMMGPMGGAANQPADAGEQLVELIRQTIAPDMWIEMGGPGSMYYWMPGRALVVRQTDEVHEQIADLLRQLRRAGN